MAGGAGGAMQANVSVSMLGNDECTANHIHEQQWRYWFAESDKLVAGGTVVRYALLSPAGIKIVLRAQDMNR